MRRLVTLLGLIGLVAAPALADVTVRYKVKNQAEKAITISVADDGNARFDSGEGAVLIVRDRVRYFVAPDRQGPIVARAEDGITVITEFFTALIGMMEQAAAPQASSGQTPAQTGGLAQMRAMAAVPYTAQARGTETVGGRTGTLYLVAPEQAGAQGPSVEIVIATDADLAPVAREMRALLGLVMRPAAALLGPSPDLLVELDGLLARGAPLRIGEEFRLDSISAAPLAASGFELPGPPLTLEQLRARLPLNAMMGMRGGPTADPAPDDE